jgi:hypothetical protein
MKYFVVQQFHIKTITLAHVNHDTIWMFKKRKIYSTIAVPKCIATVDHVHRFIQYPNNADFIAFKSSRKWGKDLETSFLF